MACSTLISASWFLSTCVSMFLCVFSPIFLHSAGFAGAITWSLRVCSIDKYVTLFLCSADALIINWHPTMPLRIACIFTDFNYFGDVRRFAAQLFRPFGILDQVNELVGSRCVYIGLMTSFCDWYAISRHELCQKHSLDLIQEWGFFCSAHIYVCFKCWAIVQMQKNLLDARRIAFILRHALHSLNCSEKRM